MRRRKTNKSHDRYHESHHPIVFWGLIRQIGSTAAPPSGIMLQGFRRRAVKPLPRFAVPRQRRPAADRLEGGVGRGHAFDKIWSAKD